MKINKELEKVTVQYFDKHLLEMLKPGLFLKNIPPPKPLTRMEKFKRNMPQLKWRLKYGFGILFGRITQYDLLEEYGDE